MQAGFQVEAAGIEERANSPEETPFSESGDVISDVSGAPDAPMPTDPAFAIVLHAWPALTDEDHKAVLAIVRKAAQILPK